MLAVVIVVVAVAVVLVLVKKDDVKAKLVDVLDKLKAKLV